MSHGTQSILARASLQLRGHRISEKETVKTAPQLDPEEAELNAFLDTLSKTAKLQKTKEDVPSSQKFIEESSKSTTKFMKKSSNFLKSLNSPLARTLKDDYEDEKELAKHMRQALETTTSDGSPKKMKKQPSSLSSHSTVHTSSSDHNVKNSSRKLKTTSISLKSSGSHKMKLLKDSSSSTINSEHTAHSSKHDQDGVVHDGGLFNMDDMMLNLHSVDELLPSKTVRDKPKAAEDTSLSRVTSVVESVQSLKVVSPISTEDVSIRTEHTEKPESIPEDSRAPSRLNSARSRRSDVYSEDFDVTTDNASVRPSSSRRGRIEHEEDRYSDDFTQFKSSVQSTPRRGHTPQSSRPTSAILTDDTERRQGRRKQRLASTSSAMSRKSTVRHRSRVSDDTQSSETYTSEVTTTPRQARKADHQCQTEPATLDYGQMFKFPSQHEPILTKIIDEEALKKLSNHNVAISLLDTMVRQQLILLQQYMSLNKAYYASFTQQNQPNHRYTSLKETKRFIARKRKMFEKLRKKSYHKGRDEDT